MLEHAVFLAVWLLPIFVVAASPAGAPAVPATTQSDDEHSDSSSSFSDLEFDPDDFAIPDDVGDLDLRDVPLAKRASIVITQYLDLAKRPSLKNLADRLEREAYLWDLLQHLTATQTEELCAQLCPEISATLLRSPELIPEVQPERAAAEKVASEPESPLSYWDSLAFLPETVEEEHFLEGDFGTIQEIVRFLHPVMPPRAFQAFCAGYPDRVGVFAIQSSPTSLIKFRPLVHPSRSTTDAYLRVRPPTPIPPTASQSGVGPPKPRRRPNTDPPLTQVPSLRPIPSLTTADPNTTPAMLLDMRYTQLIRAIIDDARRIFPDLGFAVFPKAVGQNVDTIANIYGSSITAGTGKTHIKLRFDGCRKYWRQLVRVVYAAMETNRHSLDHAFIMAFLNKTGCKGAFMARTFAWGADAFGIPAFAAFADDPTIKRHVAGTQLGAATAPTDTEKHAIWIEDDLVKYLSDLCHHEDAMIRARAFYLYLHAIGGYRYQDTSTITKIEYVGALAITITSVWEKASKTEKKTVEVCTIPLLDYKGRSLRNACEAFKLHQSTGCAFADPTAIRASLPPLERLKVPARTPHKHITSPHAQLLLRAVIEAWEEQLPPEKAHLRGAYQTATIHSFKGWLDTLATEAEFSEGEIKFLCHWDKKLMVARYNRNYSGMELRTRLKILRLLAHEGWDSVGPDELSEDPPDLRSLPKLPNELETMRRYKLDPTYRF